MVSKNDYQVSKTLKRKMRKVLGLTLGFIVISLLPVWFALAQGSIENPKVSNVALERIGEYGGTLVLSNTRDPETFNPVGTVNLVSLEQLWIVFEGLVELNAVTTEMEPTLAESWDISPDGLVWTFYLRKGVRWTDGKPLSADDVGFTFNDLIYNKDVIATLRPNLRSVFYPLLQLPLFSEIADQAIEYQI